MTDTITVTGTYVVAPDVSLAFTGVEDAFVLQDDGDTAPRLINEGVVTVACDSTDFRTVGVYSNSSHGPSFWNKSDASFTLTGRSATGFYFQGAGGSVVNDGDFVVQMSGDAMGGNAGGAGEFTNTGLFKVEGGDALGLRLNGSLVNTGRFTVSATDNAQGVDFGITHGSFDNSGQFQVSGSDDLVRGVIFQGEGDFANSGKLIVHSSNSHGGVGVYLWNASMHSFTNSGLIRAEIAINAAFQTPLGMHVENTGKILGDVVLVGSADVIDNSGHMAGVVDLGAGADLYEGSHGALKGTVFGGPGADTLMGGKSSEALWGGGGHSHSEDKADVIWAGAGADTLVGGAGADTLSGGSGADVFVYQSLSDTMISAPDLIQGLASADRIDLSAIDADAGQSGDQAFVLVAALNGHAGQAALVYDPAHHQTQLLLDVDGDGAADAEVLIKGDHKHFSGFVL